MPSFAGLLLLALSQGFYGGFFPRAFTVGSSPGTSPLNTLPSIIYMDFFAGQFFMPFLAGLLLHALSRHFYRGFLPWDIFRELFRMDDFHRFCLGGFFRALILSAVLRAHFHDGLFRSFFRSGFFCALSRWDFFPCVFCRINFSALSCEGVLGAVFDRTFLSALFSSPSHRFFRALHRSSFSPELLCLGFFSALYYKCVFSCAVPHCTTLVDILAWSLSVRSLEGTF